MISDSAIAQCARAHVFARVCVRARVHVRACVLARVHACMCVCKCVFSNSNLNTPQAVPHPGTNRALWRITSELKKVQCVRHDMAVGENTSNGQ
jgi:hypothetical protein